MMFVAIISKDSVFKYYIVYKVFGQTDICLDNHIIHYSVINYTIFNIFDISLVYCLELYYIGSVLNTYMYVLYMC